MRRSINCPHCRCEFEVAEVLATQLRNELRQEFEAATREQERELRAREKSLHKQLQEFETSKECLEQEVTSRLKAERAKLAQQLTEQAREEASVELADAKQQLVQTQTKLKEAQDAELEVRRQRAELEQQKQELELAVQRQLDQERAKIRDLAKQEAAEERELKDAEKNMLIEDMRKQIDELKRKSEQGSQQLQGEVLELALEDELRRLFPMDEITPVPKGQFGGDVLQIVRDASGVECGMILWESKRTKHWSDQWLPKLRDNQRSAKAQLAILVSVELPKELKSFDLIEGVWVTSRSCAMGLVSALRAGLLEVSKTKIAQEGRHGKMEHLYNYLSGPQFHQRIEGIAESFTTLRDDLESEKRSMHRQWAKREKQLERALVNASGMYGDLQGIIGGAMPVIDNLELPALSGPNGDC